MKRTLTLLTALLLTLSACAPGRAPTPSPTTAALLPTHTPAPAATPTPAPSPTATFTATPVPIPTLPPEQVGGLSGVPDPRYSNPELFDLTDPDAPIPQFVNAMRMAGIEVAPEQVVEGLEFEVIAGADGKEYVVGSYTVTDESGTPYSVAIKAERGEGGEWEWKRSTWRDGKIPIGGNVDAAEKEEDPRYQQIVRDEFDILFPSGAYMQHVWEEWGRSYARMFAEWTVRNSQSLYIHSAFFHQDRPSRVPNTPEGLQEYITQRLKDLIQYAKTGGKPVYFNLMNELTYQIFWDGQDIYRPSEQNPVAEMLLRQRGIDPSTEEGMDAYYKMTNEQQKELASDALALVYVEAYKLAEQNGLKPGEDLIFTVSNYRLYEDTKRKHEIEFLTRARKKIASQLGIPENEVKLVVGVQLRFDALGRDPSTNGGRGKLPPNFQDVLDSTLSDFYEAGFPVVITEVNFLDATDEQKMELYSTILAVAEKYGSPVIFEAPLRMHDPSPTNEPAGFWDENFHPTRLYYNVLHNLLGALR